MAPDDKHDLISGTCSHLPLRLRLKDETSVILSDLYLQILQYIEMHKTTLTDIIINDRESVLS
ncbi:hypothetical protein [Escherichia coli]|uniref:hypothetical protein n=1 Tax=Escherichia coli TaxID=562 RepID=UPI00067B4793|nr:hypothetical protein [Escherichia coli]